MTGTRDHQGLQPQVPSAPGVSYSGAPRRPGSLTGSPGARPPGTCSPTGASVTIVVIGGGVRGDGTPALLTVCVLNSGGACADAVPARPTPSKQHNPTLNLRDLNKFM